MNFIVVGTNHKFSPVEIREKLYFSRKNLQTYLINLLSFKSIKAAIILSTCNRVEVYASAERIEDGIESLKNFIVDCHKQELNKIGPYFYTYIGKEAIEHLFKVAAGLDSQIIGEYQILEQVESALARARAIEATDNLLEVIFNRAIEVARRVRNETNISSGDISIASIVIELIRRKYSDISDKKILIIGVGKVSALIVDALKKEKTHAIFISNRHYEKAQELARQVKGEAVRLSQLKEKLKEADAIITATASPHIILRKEDIEGLNKPLLIIDLGIPRNVDWKIKYLKQFSLIFSLFAFITMSLKVPTKIF